MVIKMIGALVMLMGSLVLFDSRRLVKKYFDFGEENNATTGMKILGFVVIVAGRNLNDCAWLKIGKIKEGEENNEFIK